MFLVHDKMVKTNTKDRSFDYTNLRTHEDILEHRKRMRKLIWIFTIIVAILSIAAVSLALLAKFLGRT